MVVLCLQDTTELDYSGQAMTGLGQLSHETQHWLYLHPTYVVTPESKRLGVMNAWELGRASSRNAMRHAGLVHRAPHASGAHLLGAERAAHV